ncbi:hypothetical protein MNEG_2518, partial [Monoraphidium neglectum]
MSQLTINDVLSYACAGIPNSERLIDTILAKGAAALRAVRKRIAYARGAIRELPEEILFRREKAAEGGDAEEAQDATNEADALQQKLDELRRVHDAVSSAGCLAEGVFSYSEARFGLEPADKVLPMVASLIDLVDVTQEYA